MQIKLNKGEVLASLQENNFLSRVSLHARDHTGTLRDNSHSMFHGFLNKLSNGAHNLFKSSPAPVEASAENHSNYLQHISHSAANNSFFD